MGKIDNKNHEFENDKDNSFVVKVIRTFQKLIDKYTGNKYTTKEEQEFFSDESNLYDENGNLTPAYKQKIKEFEQYVESHDVDSFLKKTHAKDSEEFGEAYNETEMQILSTSSSFIDDNETILKDIRKGRKDAMRSKYDFDQWFESYATAKGLKSEDIESAKEQIISEMEAVLQDEELKEILTKNIDEISKEK
jgi:hypothetical protein